MGLYLTLFVAGLLTILLPCILPLVPIVVGASIAGRSKLRPLLTAVGMLISFVGFTFLLFVVLNQFVELADYIRIGSYYVLLLFGLAFVSHNRYVQGFGAIFGALMFWDKGALAVGIAAAVGFIAISLGGMIAVRLQNFGVKIQSGAREELGQDSPLTSFVIGLTLGLVWVPCAGPALGFAFTLVREQPGLQAFIALTAYGVGAALPLLLIGYGGQYAVHSVRAVSKWTGIIKKVAGVLLIISALSLQFGWLRALETWFVQNTAYGTLGTNIEVQLFGDEVGEDMMDTDPDLLSPTVDEMNGNDTQSGLPNLGDAPELAGLGEWFNSDPLTLEQLRGKVVLVDFWTYSCINCIRTLPYLEQYWEKYGATNADGTVNLEETPFVLLGVHTPEFVFEKSVSNLQDAIDRHELKYPIVQDNDYKTWRNFENRFWPAKYLIDADGVIRYEHFGEGEYQETDEVIGALIKEAGYEIDDSGAIVQEDEGSRRQKTPETYVGPRSWDAFGNGPFAVPSEPKDYVIPEKKELHNFYLGGRWEVRGDERQVLLSDEGEIDLQWLGSEVNLVFGLEDDADPVEIDVYNDGEMIKTITVDRNDLFVLYDGEYGEHELELKIRGSGVAAYAFTFGS